MKIINHLVWNTKIESILSKNEETHLYDRIKSEHKSIEGPNRERFETLKELENNTSVQVLNDYRKAKDIASREINDYEWNDKVETMQIKINNMHSLPNRFLEAELRAWFYLQLLYIKNNKANLIGLTNEQEDAIIWLELNIFNNPELQELHNLYLEYYKNLISDFSEPYAQVRSLTNFRELINMKIAEMKTKSSNKELKLAKPNTI